MWFIIGTNLFPTGKILGYPTSSWNHISWSHQKYWYTSGRVADVITFKPINIILQSALNNSFECEQDQTINPYTAVIELDLR